MAIALREHPEAVDEPCVEEGLNPGSLLVGEAGLTDIGLWVSEVVLGVSHIEVAAHRYRLLFLKRTEVVEEGRVPSLVTKGEAAQVALGVGGVDGHEVEVLELRGDDPSLGIGIAE